MAVKTVAGRSTRKQKPAGRPRPRQGRNEPEAAGRPCYHCKQWVEPGAPHDCWTTTEAALTRDLPEDVREAWERLREAALEFGEQRIYASHKSIMFARRACYFFVRPRASVLEVCFFLGRPLKTAPVRRAARVSRTKIAHTVHVKHRDEVEPPLTDWLREAYESSETLTAAARRTGTARSRPRTPAKVGRRKA